MTRVILPSHWVSRSAGMVAMCVVALALLAPRAYAQDPAFRSTLSVAMGPTRPISARPPFDDAGNAYSAAIAVGDDFSTVGFALGYTVFGASLFERQGAVVSQFELRADCAPLAPESISPYFRLGAGAYGLDAGGSTARRVGIATGAGIRWSPRWHSAVTLVATYHNVPARATTTRQWVSLTLELMRWMD